MKTDQHEVTLEGSLSLQARRRIMSRRGEPLFIADWDRALMIHFEVDAGELQRGVPFELDLRDGRAFVTIVGFTMRGMRPRVGGRLTGWFWQTIATHEFLNLRTYVRNGTEAGIYFLTEWLSNRLAVRLGPATFGLPYRYAAIDYHNDWHTGCCHGSITAAGASLVYQAQTDRLATFEPCEHGSLEEWLMERYTAFTCHGAKKRFFRVWHPPWRQCRIDAELRDDSLLRRNWRWFETARVFGGNYSPGLRNVWMGLPHRIPGSELNL